MKLLKVSSPKKYRKDLHKILEKRNIKEHFKTISNEVDYYELIVEDSDSEQIIDELEIALHINDFGKKVAEKGTITIIKVESFLPDKKSLQKGLFKTQKISSEEIIKKVKIAANLNNNYLIFLTLSSIIAAIGLFANNPVVTIGAMIISPLIGPILGFSLSNVIEEKKLLKISMMSLGSGLIIAMLVGFLMTNLYPYPELTDEILLRTKSTLFDLGLALSAGAAGSLALLFDAGISIAGVAVAVALLPPAVVVGIGIGLLNSEIFFGSLLLLMTNLTGMAFIITLIFWLSGIKKGEKELGKVKQEKVKKKVKRIVYVMIILSLVLTYFTQKSFEQEILEKRIINDLETKISWIHIDEMSLTGREKIYLQISGTQEIQTAQAQITQIIKENLPESKIIIDYVYKEQILIE